MASWPELKPMKNRLVNYGVTDNGVAIIELVSDSDGEPLVGEKTSVNTYTREMWHDIDDAILSARFDDDVSVILLTGHGEKFFSAGASIKYLNKLTPRYKYFFCLHANETLSRLEQTPKLVIAALNGHTVGGGLEIAMAADVRIARKGNFQVGLPEVSLGVLAGTGGTARLSRLVGKAKAMEIASNQAVDAMVRELLPDEDYNNNFEQIEEYLSKNVPGTDLVIWDQTKTKEVRALEIKLTAIPDHTTAELTEIEYGSEIVVRPDTIVYLVCSIIENCKNGSSSLKPFFENITTPS